jgi:hypothetical protein
MQSFCLALDFKTALTYIEVVFLNLLNPVEVSFYEVFLKTFHPSLHQRNSVFVYESSYPGEKPVLLLNLESDALDRLL